MSPKNPDVADFLRSRRGRLEPREVGLPSLATGRRVPGLRREEVAILAGVSVDYYTRLEKGNLAGVSEWVLDGISRALRLDVAERTYLFDLARAAGSAQRSTRRTRPRRAAPTLRRGAADLVHAITEIPVIAHNRRLDVLAVNGLGSALFSSALSSPARSGTTAPVNLARYVFLDPTAERFYLDLEDIADTCVGMLRAEAARVPHDTELATLIGLLSTHSELFARLWANHDVAAHDHGSKTMHHDLVGDIDLRFETVLLDPVQGHVVTFYYPAPDTAAVDQIRLLGSWARNTRPSLDEMTSQSSPSDSSTGRTSR